METEKDQMKKIDEENINKAKAKTKTNTKTKKKDSKIFLNILRVALVILVIVLIVLFIMLLRNIEKYRFRNMLVKNDSENFSVIQVENDIVTTIKTYNGVSLTETDDNIIWISENSNTRIIEDKNYETAIITKNPDDKLLVSSLNQSYIDNLFDNNKEKFKYMGKEDEFYVVRFTNKSSDIETYLYINRDTKIVEKMVEEFLDSELIILLDVEIDCNSSDDVEMPNLDGIYTEYSSNSNVEGDAIDYIDTDDENDDEENDEDTEEIILDD